MSPTPELVSLVMRDRERDIEHIRVARLVACPRACCSPSIVDRVARALRLAPAGC